MIKTIQIILFSISLALLSSCFENIQLDGQNGNNGQNGQGPTASIIHKTTLAGKDHHYTSNCSNCHGATSISCDSCHSSDNGCKDCH